MNTPNTWILESNGIDPTPMLALEGLYTLGSGYLHLRSSLEEPLGNDPQNNTYLRMPGNVTAEKFVSTKQKWGTYVPGVYGKHPLLNRQMVNLPYVLGILLEAEGERLDLETSTILILISFQDELNWCNAKEWQDHEGLMNI